MADLKCFIKAIPQDEYSVHILGIHLQEFTSLWEAFLDSYDDLLENAKDTKISTQDVKTKYISGYILYFQLVSFSDELIDSLKSKKPIASTILIHLPPCDTLTFTGDYASWPTFDMFSVIYGTNPRSNGCIIFYKQQKVRRGPLFEFAPYRMMVSTWRDRTW